jgi:hypothetical protein
MGCCSNGGTGFRGKSWATAVSHRAPLHDNVHNTEQFPVCLIFSSDNYRSQGVTEMRITAQTYNKERVVQHE